MTRPTLGPESRRSEAAHSAISNMPRIRLVTFDLDNTLWNVQTVIRNAERRLVGWLDDHAPAAAVLYRREEDVSAMREGLIAAQPQLEHDISSLRQEILRLLLRRAGYGDADAGRLAVQAFAAFMEARHDIEFFDGALEALATLSRRFVLGSLTNGNADPKKLKLDRYLTFSFCAADVGAMKPAPNLFRKALQHSGVLADQAVHVGDHPVHDIAAAANVGMHTLWVNGPEQRSLRPASVPDKAPATVEIERLDEVVGAIERIEGMRG